MARHIQEKLKSLIHEVQHAIQVREGFAAGESSDNENRNQSAGEVEADDVKARQSMSKEDRLNTFPESMKPNQNADVVFWENGKSNEYGDANIDEDMGIRYNDDIDIPYREKKQLDEYVISANNRANKLKTLDYKEIGNNFYIWRNNSKTDFKALMQIEIDGNEDFIDNLREELYNEETKKLTQAQKDLLRGLKIFRVDEECIIVIMLMTQKAFQTEMMIDYMISHEKATQEELLSKAMEISKLKGKSH